MEECANELPVLPLAVRVHSPGVATRNSDFALAIKGPSTLVTTFHFFASMVLETILCSRQLPSCMAPRVAVLLGNTGRVVDLPHVAGVGGRGRGVWGVSYIHSRHGRGVAGVRHRGLVRGFEVSSWRSRCWAWVCVQDLLASLYAILRWSDAFEAPSLFERS